jgi:uncharacterized protein YndB with AHSA1/START domain
VAKKASRLALALAAMLLVPQVPAAEVVDSSATGFTLKSTVPIAASPDRVYAALLDVGRWWGREHTYSGDSRNLTLDARIGGCFCETLPGGGGVEHGRVVNIAPGRLLRLSAALGPLQELAVTGSWTWEIAMNGAGSTVTMTYAVGGYAPGGVHALASVVDQVLVQQVGFLKAYLEAPR